MMIAQQQKWNFEELQSKGIVDPGLANRVQNNMPTAVKEMIEKAKS